MPDQDEIQPQLALLAQYRATLTIQLKQLAVLGSALERAVSSPKPGRFLRRLVNEIGKKLDAAGIFQSEQYATIDDGRGISHGVDEEGYQEKRIMRKLPIPEMAIIFGIDSTKLFLVQTKTRWIKVDTSRKRQFTVPKIRDLFKDEVKREAVEYSIEYNRISILPDGDYHIVFSKIFERVRLEISRDIDEESPKDNIYLISAEVLAKFIRSILHDYISYMRPQATIIQFLNSFKSDL